MSTLASYDAIPYDSVPITDTHVEHLAAMARLFGVPAPEPAQARILELGCAEGGNLLPMAFYLPQTRCVGIDLSAHQVEVGNALLSAVGADNIRLLHRDVMEGAQDLGEFDYIIAHGLYSWVPPAVQARILDICARQLVPGGIAYVSFNTLPGWRSRAMVRDMLRHHARAATQPRARLALAYQFIEQYQPAFAALGGRDAAFVAEELAYLRKAPPSYLYHEYLVETNEALLFSDFMASAERAGLQYVADTELYTMLPATLGETAKQALAEIDDRVELEQVMDFLRARRFRRCLLTRVGSPVRSAPDMEVFQWLGFYADLSCDQELDLGANTPQPFVTASGARCEIRSALVKAAAMLLSSRYPDSLGFDELYEGAREILARYGDARLADSLAFTTELVSLVAYQAVRITTAPQALHCDVGAAPRAHGLARAQVAAGNENVASVRHTAVNLDEAGAALLASLDGTRDLAALTELMRTHVEADLDDATLRGACERMLWTFARNGLLEP